MSPSSDPARAVPALDPCIQDPLLAFSHHPSLRGDFWGRSSYHVAYLTGGTGKDEDGAGAVGSISILEIIPGAAELALHQVLCRSSQRDGSQRNEGGDELHLEGLFDYGI